MKELIEKIKKYAASLTKAGVSAPEVPGMSPISANIKMPAGTAGGTSQMKTEKQNLGGIPNPVQSRSQ